jgi:hypothetical protein
LIADKPRLQFNVRETDDDELILRHAAKLGFEGVKSRFGSSLVPSRVHCAEPTLVAEITYLSWTADGAASTTPE